MASMHSQKLERQRRLLREDSERGVLTDTDADAIQEFMEYDVGENKPGTVASHLTSLRSVARRADFELTDADTDALLDLLRSFKSGTHPDVKDGGIIVNNYVSALRVFYRHHDLGIDHRDIEIDEDYNGRELSADDLLYKDEIDAFFEAAQRASVRDLAFIALTLATGQRVDAVRTLRRKHVTVDGPTMEVKLNVEEGDLKGAKGAKPLLWAKHYVRPWYESHPHKGNPDAALFPATENDPTAGDSGTWKTEPMSQSAVRYIVETRAADAGIEKDVYPHLLRHCAITRMAAQGDLSEQQIKNIVGWGGDSSQFGTYVTLADEIATDSIRESLGVPTSDSGAPVVGRPSLETCPNCGDELPDGTERCRTCKTPMTQAEAQRQEKGGSDDLEELTQLLDDASDDELGAAVRQYLQSQGD